MLEFLKNGWYLTRHLNYMNLSIGNRIDLDLNCDLNHYWISFKSTFAIWICHLNPIVVTKLIIICQISIEKFKMLYKSMSPNIRHHSLCLFRFLKVRVYILGWNWIRGVVIGVKGPNIYYPLIQFQPK